jgi:hypothetical protein
MKSRWWMEIMLSILSFEPLHGFPRPLPEVVVGMDAVAGGQVTPEGLGLAGAAEGFERERGAAGARSEVAAGGRRTRPAAPARVARDGAPRPFLTLLPSAWHPSSDSPKRRHTTEPPVKRSEHPAAPHRPNDDGGDKQDRNAQLQIHLAEYQAITTRNTYWLTLQYALFPILGAAIAVLAQMWNQFDEDPALSTQSHRIIIWLVIALANVIMIAHTEVGWESYDNVVYLELSALHYSWGALFFSAGIIHGLQ